MEFPFLIAGKNLHLPTLHIQKETLHSCTFSFTGTGRLKHQEQWQPCTAPLEMMNITPKLQKNLFICETAVSGQETLISPLPVSSDSKCVISGRAGGVNARNRDAGNGEYLTAVVPCFPSLFRSLTAG